MSNKGTPIRRSAADWRALVEACERSGLSRREFANREGLHRATFYFWASRLAPRHSPKRRGAASEPTTPFVSVRVQDPERGKVRAQACLAAPMVAVGSKVEVVLGNGRRVRCQLSQIDDPRLAVLLTLVEGGRGC